MDGALTRGQPQALAAVEAMVAGSAPHALLLVGPGSSGKTTLALDLAAGLLCLDGNPAARPCRRCRGCRQIASGNHPDLHWLAPEGPGGQVRIGRPVDPEPGTVRHLVAELALLSVEGGARLAIVEQAHRLNEDAQNALLKLLEEPPPGVTIVLCADEEERLLPTVRSRCVRVRLGPVGVREIERWLTELGVADAPEAARFARLARGLPGLAVAYARAPAAARLRGEIARGLLDLLSAGRAARLASMRALTASAAELNASLAEARRSRARGFEAGSEPAPHAHRRRARGSGEMTADVPGPGAGTNAGATSPEAEQAGSDGAPNPSRSAAGSAADRRAAVATLLEAWASVARDIAVTGRGGAGRLEDPELLEELEAATAQLDPGEVAVFLPRLTATALQIEENVNPELALDVLGLAWPRLRSSTPDGLRLPVGPGGRA